jgi:hypothetical protein
MGDALQQRGTELTREVTAPLAPVETGFAQRPTALRKRRQIDPESATKLSPFFVSLTSTPRVAI